MLFAKQPVLFFACKAGELLSRLNELIICFRKDDVGSKSYCNTNQIMNFIPGTRIL